MARKTLQNLSLNLQKKDSAKTLKKNIKKHCNYLSK